MPASAPTCALCRRPIADHRPDVHGLRLPAGRVVDLCEECVRAVVTWQGERLARLFPTRAMKRRYGPRGDA